MNISRLLQSHKLLPKFSRTLIATGNETVPKTNRFLTAKFPNKKPEIHTPDSAVSCIKSGDNLFFHAAAATPFAMMKAVKNHCILNDLNGIKIYHMHLEGEPILTAPECYNRIRSFSLFTGPNCRTAIADGFADFISVFLGQLPKILREEYVSLDYAIVQVSAPDEHGYCSLGTSVDWAMAACQKSKSIIAYVNKQMPRTFGDGIIHMSQFDRVVMADEPIYIAKPKQPTPEEIKIGKYIVDNLIEDGSTLQMGIGSIPTAVLTQISSHKHLGIHSEMISDPVVDLVESGIVDNSQKNIHRWKTVSSFSVGSEKLYNFMNNNPAFLMLDVAFTNDPCIISQNPKVAAINSCIEIDLTGQIVSDSIGTRIYSGIGGQSDFITGAGAGKDGKGKAIMTLLSSTKRGESKIVPFLKQGGGVVTTRGHAHYVVTEYGIASLFSKSIKERAYELIKIAHPDHRESLDRAAFERFKSRPPFNA